MKRTLESFMTESTSWKPYVGNRKSFFHSKGFIVIIPNDELKSQPLTCEVCDYVFRTREDANSWHEFGCCERCAMLWAIPRRKDWEAGWRPSKEQLAKSEVERPPLVMSLDVE